MNKEFDLFLKFLLEEKDFKFDVGVYLTNDFRLAIPKNYPVSFIITSESYELLYNKKAPPSVEEFPTILLVDGRVTHNYSLLKALQNDFDFYFYQGFLRNDVLNNKFNILKEKYKVLEELVD